VHAEKGHYRTDSNRTGEIRETNNTTRKRTGWGRLVYLLKKTSKRPAVVRKDADEGVIQPGRKFNHGPAQDGNLS